VQVSITLDGVHWSNEKTTFQYNLEYGMFSIFVLTVVYAGLAIAGGWLIWKWAKNRPIVKEVPQPEPGPNPADSMTVGYRRKGPARRR
jgi:hypothetical protein